MSGKGLQLKTTTLLVFFLWLGKSLKNLYIIVLLISYRNVDFFPESCMVLDLSHQFQIFLQLYLAELVELLTGLKLQHLIYPRFLTGFDMSAFVKNLSLMEFLVRYLTFFLLFSLKDGFE